MSETRLVLATFNPHKFDEINGVFQVPGVTLVSLRNYPDVQDAPEEGKTFEEIAQQKAEYYFGAIRSPVLSEDSGLVIPSLKGFPGIHSARIAGDDHARIQLILDRLKDLEAEGESSDQGKRDEFRYAFYVCSMAFRTSKGLWMTEGRCSGVIRRNPEGTQGFGYDPVFCPEGSDVTFGNMSRAEKAQFSHRIRALKEMIPIIQEVLGGGA